MAGTSNYANAVLARNPDAYWRHDDTEGDLTDSSGHGRHAGGDTVGTLRGQPTLLACPKAGSSIFYNEEGTGFNIPYDPSWMDAAELTVISHVQISDRPNTKTIAARRLDGTGGGCWHVRINAGDRLEAALWAGGTPRIITSDTVVVEDEPYRTGVTYDGRTATLFLDGQVEKAVDFGSTVPLDVNPRVFEIGTWGGDADFDQRMAGHMDELAYWGTALSAADVLAIMAADTPCRGLPPLRGRQRSDGLAGSSAPRGRQHSSRQATLRGRGFI